MLAYWVAKRFVTVPRIGQAKFGRERKVRRIKTALINCTAPLGDGALCVVFTNYKVFTLG